MEKEGVIQKVPGDQKRNQFFRLNLVQSQVPSTHSHVDAVQNETASKMPQTANDRLGRMEDALLAIQQKLSSIENKLDRALMVWL
jgi:hypothetical protein